MDKKKLIDCTFVDLCQALAITCTKNPGIATRLINVLLNNYAYEICVGDVRNRNLSFLKDMDSVRFHKMKNVGRKSWRVLQDALEYLGVLDEK